METNLSNWMTQEEVGDFRLMAALRRKFGTAAAALQALGLDAKLLEDATMPLSPTASVAKSALLAVLARRMQPGKRVNEARWTKSYAV